MRKIFLILCLIPFMASLSAAERSGQAHRWHITPSGGIEWSVSEDNIPHSDHIEMSGEQVSAVLRYGVDATGGFRLERSMVWPMLRTIPNNTHASLMQRFAFDVPSSLIINGLTIQRQKVESIALDGKLTVSMRCGIGYVNVGSARNRASEDVVRITAEIFPSVDKPALCERYTIRNITERPISVLVPDQKAVYKTIPARGVDGSYTMVAAYSGSGTYVIAPMESIVVGATVQAYKKSQQELAIDVDTELGKRQAYVDEVWSNLRLETPDDIINREFAFAKIRASESIYKTKGGYMHGPGGESYYAAIWANDQAEYVNPFFPYLGYSTGNLSALNSFRHFARFMNDNYWPIPSSIIAEGDDIWHGVGDRGDGAMIAYGAARYALASGDRQQAEELWPLIEWCLEFCRRKINEHGVVASDTDELENRFPSGDANLYTSCLYYDALLSASYLCGELGKSAARAATYLKQAKTIRAAIENYFGATVEGFGTYRYYDGNDILRSWICIPLTVGIYDRAEGTVAALFSERMWTRNGLLTEAGSDTFWDRSTLYALMGVLEAGATQKGIRYLHDFSGTRLLGEHVPYPIEAWPEGSQRHLSAESGLYCRIITEGVFGIRPTGLRSFTVSPRLPDGWDEMALRNIKAYGSTFDMEVSRKNSKLQITIVSGGRRIVKSAADGDIVKIKL